ncbi:hypothetical protein T01_5364 [Trichinella spiralis]|uniref:Uncharacterized protein n=1 Tax=Trichinella spiralis TaxID=6334 RepID=A0A0V1B213_TRISP|nr:hypothetical protein T01_5364 [Trichinella spiralis]
MVLIAKQRKGIEEAVCAALEVVSFMIWPCPDIMIGATSQTSYNEDPVENGIAAKILRSTKSMERMQLKLKGIEQRI